MSWLDALGWAGSAVLVFSLMQARVLRFRVLNLVGCIVLVVFNGMLEVWPMVGMNVVLAGINIWFLRDLLADRHDEHAFSVIGVGADDEYLRHVLMVHGPDIAKTHPGFPGTVAPGTLTYLVLRSDETVGVVLIRDAGDGVAAVVLDYVTPRFRDFSPGEFVWRRSSLLREAGFTKVVTEPDIIAPYYDRIGFRREGDSFVLEL